MCIKRFESIATLAWVWAVVTGCKAPELTGGERLALPESDIIGASDTSFVRPVDWDAFFQDTILRGYVETALANNHSFRQSMERVAMSRAALTRAKGLRLPEVDLNIGASATRFGEYTMDGVGNSETNVPSLAADKHIPDPYKDLAIGLSLRWEADIWGRLSRQKQAAAARWMASVEATRLARSILIADLAIRYYELVSLDKREEVLRGALASAREAYDLTRELKKEGAETQLAVDQFYARALSLESKLLENEQLAGETERAIACLLGVFPFEVRRMTFDQLRRLPVPLEEGVPANLLTLRPDVRAAEMELVASKADALAARAAFYPSLVLGASGGFNAFNVGKWFQAPASLVYDLAAGITAPIFRRGEIRAMWEEAKASQRAALSRYHETALAAYTEVLDLYRATQTQAARIRLKEEESLAHRRSVENASEMFRLTYVGFLEVLSAEERYLDSELEYVDIVNDFCQKKILLFRALGGGSGWE